MQASRINRWGARGRVLRTKRSRQGQKTRRGKDSRISPPVGGCCTVRSIVLVDGFRPVPPTRSPFLEQLPEFREYLPPLSKGAEQPWDSGILKTTTAKSGEHRPDERSCPSRGQQAKVLGISNLFSTQLRRVANPRALGPGHALLPPFAMSELGGGNSEISCPTSRACYSLVAPFRGALHQANVVAVWRWQRGPTHRDGCANPSIRDRLCIHWASQAQVPLHLIVVWSLLGAGYGSRGDLCWVSEHELRKSRSRGRTTTRQLRIAVRAFQARSGCVNVDIHSWGYLPA